MAQDRVDEGGLGLGYRTEGIGGVAELGPVAVQRLASRSENGGGGERWNAALGNVSEMGSALSYMHSLLLGKAVYMDEDPFAHASANAKQVRVARAQERRIRSLEREVDAAVSAAAHARAEKREAEMAQRAAESRTQEVLRELEDTTKVFELHMEELRMKQLEVQKKDDEIIVLQAIIDAIRSDTSIGSKQTPSSKK